jgi:hypothetical protein
MKRSCKNCNKEITHRSKSGFCNSCSAKERYKDPKKNPNFKDGRTVIPKYCLCGREIGYRANKCKYCVKFKGGKITKEGYKKIRINGKYIQEHRYIMEKYLNRKLLPFPIEIVHHINRNKLDNSIKNLELTNNSLHTIFHNKLKTIKPKGIW